jgi:hypothetical protein
LAQGGEVGSLPSSAATVQTRGGGLEGAGEKAAAEQAAPVPQQRQRPLLLLSPVAEGAGRWCPPSCASCHARGAVAAACSLLLATWPWEAAACPPRVGEVEALLQWLQLLRR